MRLKQFNNGIVLFIGLMLSIYYQFDQYDRQSTKKLKPIIAQRNFNQVYDRWQVKENSIYDGNKLTVQRGEEELKVRLCGIQAPEIKQPLGIEARDYLQSLVNKSNGTIFVTPVEKNEQETIAELYVYIGNRQALFLNSQMIAGGAAWHARKNSSNCPNQKALITAENIAKQKKLGVQSTDYREPRYWLRQSVN